MTIRHPNVIKNLRDRAETARAELLHLLTESSRDHEALLRGLETYAEYQSAADLLARAGDGAS